MTDTPAHTAATLAERARTAAERRTGHYDPTWRDPRWTTRAHQVAARLALILAIPADQIQIEASTLRRYGGWPWPELTITDHGEHRFRFAAAYGDPDQITALKPCPFCDAEVPTFPVRTLADLGDLLTGNTDYTDDEPVPAFYQDPGHKPDCQYAAPTP